MRGRGQPAAVTGASSRESNAARSRVPASAATASRPLFSVMPTITCGSIASTAVDAAPSARTTTLHGSSSPMDGSACRAAWASGGRQAPRMICAGTSTPVFCLEGLLDVDFGEYSEAHVVQCVADLFQDGGERSGDRGGEGVGHVLSWGSMTGQIRIDEWLQQIPAWPTSSVRLGTGTHYTPRGI